MLCLPGISLPIVAERSIGDIDGRKQSINIQYTAMANCMGGMITTVMPITYGTESYNQWQLEELYPGFNKSGPYDLVVGNAGECDPRKYPYPANSYYIYREGFYVPTNLLFNPPNKTPIYGPGAFIINAVLSCNSFHGLKITVHYNLISTKRNQFVTINNSQNYLI